MSDSSTPGRFARVRCILFDLDGTLADSAPDLGRAANGVREDLGLPPLPLEDYRSSASGGARGLLDKALGIGPGDERFPGYRDRFLELYAANGFDRTTLFEGMAGLLQQLDRRGFSWGVVTNKAARFSHPMMQSLDNVSRCACLVSGDEVAKPKPAPDSLLLACEKLALMAGAIVYVGDDRRDIIAGRAAGMVTVAAAWGYLGLHPDPSNWGADAVIEHPLLLLDLLPASPLQIA